MFFQILQGCCSLKRSDICPFVLTFVFLSSFALKVYANPINSVRFMLGFLSCVERGGIKLDRPFNGYNCASGMSQRNCRCGDQCIVSRQWCCNGEICNEEKFWVLHFGSLHSTEAYSQGRSCVQRGGVKLDHPFEGKNCGSGKSYRSCKCGDQCIVKRQFCCRGVICNEEVFQAFFAFDGEGLEHFDCANNGSKWMCGNDFENYLAQ